MVALLVAPLGSTVVALNFSSLGFMFPMSIGAAVSIRVGHKLGEPATKGAAIAANVGLMTGPAACITALLTVLFREQIALLYTETKWW